jgi:hypothetical protein
MKSWEREQQAEQTLSESMEARVDKAVLGFRKNPDAVSKKSEEAIKHMGVKPDSRLVERLAAQVVAYRLEHTAWRAERPSKIPQLECCMRRVCRRRCAQWWKSTSPNTKKMQPRVEGRGHRTAEDDDKGSRITQVGVEGREIKTAEDDNDG